MTFTERLRCFPPILCRLLAKPVPYDKNQTYRAFSYGTTYLVDCVSRELSWDDIKVSDMVAFMGYLDLRFDDTKAMRRLDDLLNKRPAFSLLRKSLVWDTYYKPMLVRWRNAYPYNVTPDIMPHKGVRQLLNRLTPLHDSHRINTRK